MSPETTRVHVNDPFDPPTTARGSEPPGVVRPSPVVRQRFGTVADSSPELVKGLFQKPEQWGWEYVEPAAVRPYPHLVPQWSEPAEPDIDGYWAEHEKAQAALRTRLTPAAWLGLTGALLVASSHVGTKARLPMGATFEWGVLVLLVAAVLAGFAYYRVRAPLLRMRATEQQAFLHRETLHQRFREAEAHWREQAGHHHAAECRRIQAVPLLFPTGPATHCSRVDVFGGTPAGWASLLATMGSSALADGTSLTVLDLSDQNLAGPLAELAGLAEVVVTAADAPASLTRPGLIGDLPPEDLAEVLAEALGAVRGNAEQPNLHALYFEVIHAAACRLDRPLSFARLAAAIRVFRSTYGVDGDGPLSPAEIARLTDQIDLVGGGDRVRDELRFAGNQLELLGRTQAAADDDGVTDPVALWTPRGLSVIRTRGNARAKLLTDHILFRAVARRVGEGRPTVADPMLVVVGADSLGRSGLELMVRHAWRSRVRLVYLFEHLRDDAADLLGGGDSAAVLMRIGNPREADTAASYIGRGYSFTLSQVARQLGRTVTQSANDSVTDQTGGSTTDTQGGSDTVTTGENESSGTSRPDSSGPGKGSGRPTTSQTEGTSRSHALSDSWSRALTRTWSRSATVVAGTSDAESTSDTETYSRSYEFVVEPSTIQELEPTAFILVQGGPNGRRPTMGDCYPGLAVVDRVNPTPRSA